MHLIQFHITYLIFIKFYYFYFIFLYLPKKYQKLITNCKIKIFYPTLTTFEKKKKLKKDKQTNK